MERAGTTWESGPGVVTLPDGRRIRGRGLRHPEPSGPPPDFGLYLLSQSPPPTDWPAVWVRWPDFRLPTDRNGAVAELNEAHMRAASERVEVACRGGVGRTGTALAVLAILSGIQPAEAVAWVRANYHPRAVETPWQRRWIAGLDLRRG